MSSTGIDLAKADHISSMFKRSGWKSLLTFVILALACVAGFSSRLFSVIRFESIIHEFDPWFNYRSTRHMVEHGFYNFLNWFDDRAWYPLGRIVGGTVFPGLMVTSGTIHWLLHLLNFPVHIRDICVFLAPMFSGLTAISMYYLTSEVWSRGAGLFAACFMAIVPGYISRSVAGSYDNEGIAIFALVFTYYLWIKAVKTGQVFWALCTALSYFYMVSAWGGYVFIINLIPLHVFTLLLMGRYSSRIFTGVFVLLYAYALLQYLQPFLRKREYRRFFILAAVLAAGTILLCVLGLTWSGYIAPWSGRFYSLWDTGYAKIHIPIIASVSEHQPTTWVAFFFDLHILICTFPAGVWYCIRNINDERVFVVLYAVFASYFAGVMVRLMLILTPIVCILASIAFSRTFEIYLKDDSSKSVQASSADDSSTSSNDNLYDKVGRAKKVRREVSREEEPLGMNIKVIVVFALMMMLMLFAVHCTWMTSSSYSSPSIVLASYNKDGSQHILDDFREAYHWLQENTADRARVMSWWDYGYQIAGMGNRTTLVDNNTWNNSHIALVGKAMSSNESAAYDIMRMLDVDYVLVIFGGVIGYSGDDINKFLWMVRIAEGEHPKDIKESDYFTANGDFRVDVGGSKTLLNCLMYKLSYYRFGQMQLDHRSPPGFDRTRGVEIGNKNFELKHLEEAYTTEHWLVRIYRVKDLVNRMKVLKPVLPVKKSKRKVSRVIGGRVVDGNKIVNILRTNLTLPTHQLVTNVMMISSGYTEKCLTCLSISDVTLREVVLTRLLQHENILPHYCSFIHGHNLWVVMPAMGFGSCRDVIQAYFTAGLSELAVTYILRDVLRALDYLHRRGIIHRCAAVGSVDQELVGLPGKALAQDATRMIWAVKASHVLMSGTGQVCLTGLSNVLSTMTPDRRVSSVFSYPDPSTGCLQWLSPEILEQNLAGYNSQSDIYSVGVLACELANGQAPFTDMALTQMLLEKLGGTKPMLADSTTCGQFIIDDEEEDDDADVDADRLKVTAAEKAEAVFFKRTFSQKLHRIVSSCLDRSPGARPTACQLLSDQFFGCLRKKSADVVRGALYPVSALSDCKTTLPADHDSEVTELTQGVRELSTEDGWSF